ncbi:MAG TPA: hypothetical protein VHG08_07145 [Longimicrobium sp.]|nr:hypothetical protein [Longimicrobium sp.]
MRTRILIAAVALVAIGLSAAPRPATACYVCSSSQWCMAGAEGSSCFVYNDPDGVRRCQFSTDCGQITMTPLQVSPAGTYLAAAGAPLAETDGEKVACNGFVVAHTAQTDDGAGVRHEIRI